MTDEESLARWTRKSSRCKDDHCVMVTAYDDRVEMFNSKSPGGARLAFTPPAWQTFLDDIQAGGFDC